MSRRLILAALPLSLLAGCGAETPAKVAVADAWVRLPAVAGRPGALYFELKGGAEPVRLVAVDAEGAGRTELHETARVSAMMTMRRLDGVDVPVGEALRFAPGGRHVMLFDLAPSLASGGRTRITVRFAKGEPLTAEARIVAAGADGPA